MDKKYIGFKYVTHAVKTHRSDLFPLLPLTLATQFGVCCCSLNATLQVYSSTLAVVLGCSEGLPSALLIHTVDLLCAVSYLIELTQCASALLSASKEPVLS